MPDLVVTSWGAISVPAGTPRPIVERLSEAIRAAAADPATQARFAPTGNLPLGSTPEEAAARAARERPMWREAVRISGARLTYADTGDDTAAGGRRRLVGRKGFPPGTGARRRDGLPLPHLRRAPAGRGGDRPAARRRLGRVLPGPPAAARHDARRAGPALDLRHGQPPAPRGAAGTWAPNGSGWWLSPSRTSRTPSCSGCTRQGCAAFGSISPNQDHSSWATWSRWRCVSRYLVGTASSTCARIRSWRPSGCCCACRAGSCSTTSAASVTPRLRMPMLSRRSAGCSTMARHG